MDKRWLNLGTLSILFFEFACNEVAHWFQILLAFELKGRAWPHEVDDLYYLCLFSDMSIRSLRDLRGEHVPLLKRIQQQVVNGLAEKHRVASSGLLAYVPLMCCELPWLPTIECVHICAYFSLWVLLLRFFFFEFYFLWTLEGGSQKPLVRSIIIPPSGTSTSTSSIPSTPCFRTRNPRRIFCLSEWTAITSLTPSSPCLKQSQTTLRRHPSQFLSHHKELRSTVRVWVLRSRAVVNICHRENCAMSLLRSNIPL